MEIYNTKLMQLNNSKILKIELQNDVRSYFTHAVLLCVIKSYDEYQSWYYQNYINIKSNLSAPPSGSYIKMDYVEVNYEEVFTDFIKFSYNNSIDVISFIKEKINEGYYLLIFIDYFYMPNTRFYKKYHHMHDVLVYGYDDVKSEIYIINYDENLVLNTITYKFYDFEQSFAGVGSNYKDSKPWINEMAIRIFTLKNYDKIFNLKKFNESLQDFILSKSMDKNQINGDDYIELEKRINKFGLDVYDIVISGMNFSYKDVSIDYRAFHFLTDHKKGMYKRLEFVTKNIYYNNRKNLLEYLIQYKDIVQTFEIIRTIYLKSILKQSNFKDIYSPIIDCTIINKISEMLNIVKKKEKKLLETFYELFLEKE